MAEELANSRLRSRSGRIGSSRRFRLLGVLATSATLWLGVAGPALASDGEEPAPPVPALPDPTVAELPVLPEAPPTPAALEPVPVEALEATASPPLEPAQLDEPPTIATETESGNVNVSVRVLSPGEDEPVSQKTDASGVVSAGSEADISPDPAPSAPDPTTGSSQIASTNTNVSVRVLSPGDNGPVNQTSTPATPATGAETAADGEAEEGEEAGTIEADGTAPSGGSAEELSGSPLDSEQYHESNSQYQSDSMTSNEPWNWAWKLVIDCAENVTSISTQTGSQTSLSWLWTWTWDWGCDPSGAGETGNTASGTDGSLGAAPGAAVSQSPTGSASPTGSSGAAASNSNVSVRVLSPGDNGPVNQSNTDAGAPDDVEAVGVAPSGSSTEQAPAPASDPDEAPNEPWSWTWTFTFCGTTTSVSTQAGSQTALSWTWDWTWNWTCTGASTGSEITAAPGGDPPSVTAPEPQPNQVFAAPDDASGASESSSATEAGIPAPELGSLTAVIEEQSTSQPLVPVLTPPVPALPAVPLPELPPFPAPPVVGSVDVDIAVVIPPEPRLPELSAVPIPPPTATAIVPSAPQGMGHVPMPVPDAPAHGGLGSRPLSETAIAPASEIPRGHRTGRGSRPPSATRVDKASSRHARGPMLPPSLPNPLHVVGSGGASGGIVPSALLLGLAAVIGFFILVAPGLGRRIRPARELRPRSRYQAPIDDPG